jgi:hypothetical protein
MKRKSVGDGGEGKHLTEDASPGASEAEKQEALEELEDFLRQAERLETEVLEPEVEVLEPELEAEVKQSGRKGRRRRSSIGGLRARPGQGGGNPGELIELPHMRRVGAHSCTSA